MKGSDGKPIKIPCACPPDRQLFIEVRGNHLSIHSLLTFLQKLNANVAAGHVLTNPSVGISFPSDNSKASQHARINAAAVTLQNLNGPGKGCPIVSTTFSAQNVAIDAVPVPVAAPAKVSSATPAKVTTSAAAKSTPAAPATPASKLSIDPNLVPPFGFQAGVNPTGMWSFIKELCVSNSALKELAIAMELLKAKTANLSRFLAHVLRIGMSSSRCVARLYNNE